MRANNKIAIVTGAAGGIGRACAEALVREGATVVMTDISEHTGTCAASEIGATFYRHDVSEEAGWEILVTKVLNKHGRIDVLVNVAAIEGNLHNDFGATTSLSEWHRVMRINLDGPFLGCRAVFPSMMETGTGSIINMSSTASFAATPVALAYGASKAGVEQLSRSFAALGTTNGKRVRCNSVHPGMIRTRMTDENIAHMAKANGIDFEEAESIATAGIPMGARGKPDDIASMVVYLASDEAQYVTGTAFRVDGGWTLLTA